MWQSKKIASWLGSTHSSIFVLWCMFAAFITYFSMYAFRKPFTVAQYEDLVFWGVGYKVILLFSQIGGYAISKFIGIKVVSEMTPGRRAMSILFLIAIAHLALLPYAVSPYWLKPVFLFCNGLPLGMVFGCVFAFLEGRRVTELLAAGLCASFIMASGSVKSVGSALMTYYDVSQFWMPFATGALFWPSLVIGVWMLEQIPVPNKKDVESRFQRSPINSDERKSFFESYRGGLIVLILIVVMMTLFRSIRDDYAAEIWSGFGVEKPEIFAQSETIVAAVVLVLSGLVVLVRGNLRAFQVSMWIVAGSFFGAVVLVASHWQTKTWTEQSAFMFMVLLGISLYTPYVLFHTTIFERLLATVRRKANIGYLIYLGDFAGYMSTVILMVVVNVIFQKELNFVSLLMWLAIAIAPISIIGSLWTIRYFSGKSAEREEQRIKSEESSNALDNPDSSH